MTDELLKILEDLLSKYHGETIKAEERFNQAEDKEAAVRVVIEMLKKETQ